MRVGAVRVLVTVVLRFRDEGGEVLDILVIQTTKFAYCPPLYEELNEAARVRVPKARKRR